MERTLPLVLFFFFFLNSKKWIWKKFQSFIFLILLNITQGKPNFKNILTFDIFYLPPSGWYYLLVKFWNFFMLSWKNVLQNEVKSWIENYSHFTIITTRVQLPHAFYCNILQFCWYFLEYHDIIDKMNISQYFKNISDICDIGASCAAVVMYLRMYLCLLWLHGMYVGWMMMAWFQLSMHKEDVEATNHEI